jgi:CO/xanthine dehydrogenase FAD-binding subunit
VSVNVKTFAHLADAASALMQDRGARFLAGGTLLMRAVNEADPGLRTIVRSTDPSLTHIGLFSGRVELGAGVTMAAILAERELAYLHPAARAVGGPAVREAASVGGNLFASSPYGDFAVVLLALDATVMLAGGVGQRELPLEELLSRRDRGAFLVARVAFKRPASDAFRFSKITRVRPKGISVLSIAAQLPLSGGRVTGARIAYGAMAPTPVRAKAAERALEGRPLDASGVASALAVAHDGTSPSDDPVASAWWRREILPVYLRRLLLGEQPMRAS